MDVLFLSFSVKEWHSVQFCFFSAKVFYRRKPNNSTWVSIGDGGKEKKKLPLTGKILQNQTQRSHLEIESVLTFNWGLIIPEQHFVSVADQRIKLATASTTGTHPLTSACGILEKSPQCCCWIRFNIWSARPDLCSDYRTTMIIYALVTEGYPADLWGRTSGSSDAAPVCAGTLYLYTLCVWGAVKACAGSSITLCMAHMSGTLLVCSFTPRHRGGRSHFHVWQSSDVASAIY